MDPHEAGVAVMNDTTTMSNSNYCVKLGATLNQNDDIPPGNSPTTSISSMQSEQSDIFRNSPYLAQSPLSSTALFQRPDFCSAEGDRPMSYPSISSFSTNLPDSECSSRSSMDGYNLKDSTSEKIKRFRERHQASPPGSSSEEEDNDSNESDPVRKLSSKSSEEKFVPRGIDAPRGRIANIRRESSCSMDTEAAHERLVKASQVVSNGFDDIAIEPDRSPSSSSEFRRRAPSFNAVLGEPISVVTNAFITTSTSCSPSPTRQTADSIKQCYSPSTQQIIRPNMSYSPSPRPSPAQSPTRHGHKIKFQRSESPICRPNKRKITLAAPGEFEAKRLFVPKSNTSPLVTDKTFPYPSFGQLFDSTPMGEFNSFSVPHSPAPLRSTTPMSSFSGDQEDNSLSVKDVEEKIFDDVEDMENNDVISCIDDDDEMAAIEDINDINDIDNDQKANEELLRAATEASLPDDDDDLLDYDDSY